MEKKRRTRTVAAVAVATVFCWLIEAARGMDSSIYSTLQPFIIEYYGASLTVTSLFTTAEGAGHMLINLLIVWLADRFDKVNVLSALVLMLAGVMLGIGAAPAMGLFIALKFMQGMLSPFMDNVNTGYTSDLHPDRRSTAVGVLFMVFSLASALMPSFNTLVVDVLKQPWYVSYRSVGYFLLAVGVLFLITFSFIIPRPVTLVSAQDGQKSEKKLSIRTMLQNRNMQALFLSNVTMSFYNYFSSFLPTFFFYTKADVYTTAVRGFIVTCNSVGRLISRILYVPMSRRMDTIRYMRFQAIAGTVINLACFLADRSWVWMAGMFISGLLCGSAFTARTVLTCEEYPEYSSSATAATAIAQSIAALAATPIMNAIAEKVSFTAAMLIPIGFGFATYFVFRFMYTAEKKTA